MEKYRFEPNIFAEMEASPVPFAVYQFIDRRVVTLVLSAGFCELFGLDRTDAYDLMDNDMYRYAHPDDIARIADDAVRFAVKGGEYNVVYRSRRPEEETWSLIHAKGRHVWTDTGVRLAYVWYTDEGAYAGEALSGGDLSLALGRILRDDARIYQTRYDELTGLPNMTYFFALADSGLRRMAADNVPSALLFMDMCGMKSFNSKWGFSEGDRLIRDFGHLLAETFSSESCGRFGQDHFAVFTAAEDLEEKLSGLFAACKILNDGKSLPVRVGIYRAEGQPIEIGKACDLAKMACDANRKVFDSRYHFFTPDMLARAEKHQYIIDNLDRALAEGWIRVYYQPIVRAANGRVCDEEALSRWIDPVRGFLSPADFIPALEESHLIWKLDLFVVDQILKKMRTLADAGLYIVPQSVNLSRADFESCDIVEEIRRRVDESGIGRDKLTVEITESVVGSDFDFMKEQIERFRALGFSVWMDDFGSGYSSLDVLQTIRFDLIKFDMRFMQQFGKGDEAKIILTELVRMAVGLGLETVCEGVEEKEQVEFLREIGCTKLQGFYFCKPIPPEQIIERNEKGIQIGFENPEESDYYAAIGRINLYDMAVLAGENSESIRRYFDTLPTAIMEVRGTVVKYIRCSKAYRDFMEQSFGVVLMDTEMDYAGMPVGPGSSFMSAVMRCSRDRRPAIIDEKYDGNTTVHSFIRWIAANPVTGTAAVAVAVLAVTKDQGTSGTTYAHIARALSADYVYLYYVDLKTERFTEYSSDPTREDLSVERHGEDFFAASRRDALVAIDPADRDYFVHSFHREKILKALDTQGTFTLTYRLLIGDSPVYVNMKISRMPGDATHLIIGVSNVDGQMRHREEMERIQAERTTYARITALDGDYIAVYTVDPVTGHYTEYSALPDYERLGFDKQGQDFFEQSREDGRRTVYPEDLDRFLSLFTRENIMRELEDGGSFELQYRLIIDGEPTWCRVKAAIVQEKDGPQIIVGVNNVDSRVRRIQEYERSLSAARMKAGLDTLTGIRNRTAYDSMSESLSRQIQSGQPVQYAIALCRVTDIARTNETQGRPAGDRLIRDACSVICHIFEHSPVFRVGGDEFAAVLQGQDYDRLQELSDAVEEHNRRAAETGGAAIACGIARYDGTGSVSSVFERAETLCRNHP